MKPRWILGIVVIGVILITLPLSSLAAEEKWPTRPITIYIGYAPGGGMDMM
jgi:tripartite-type tricarboxylate transporter receptor subunit TctC